MKFLFNKENSILFFFTIGGVYLIISAIFFHAEDFDSQYGLCMFKNISGIDCPGCGMTRSFICLLRGDLDQSIHYHRFGIPTFFAFSIYYSKIFLKIFFQKDFFSFRFIQKEKIISFVSVLFLSVYIIKLYQFGIDKILSDFHHGLAYKIFSTFFG